jgi:hypothetical protein
MNKSLEVSTVEFIHVQRTFLKSAQVCTLAGASYLKELIRALPTGQGSADELDRDDTER